MLDKTSSKDGQATRENVGAPLVSLNGAGVFRSGRWLVRGVSFTVAPGEIVTLVGPNGSGKSTSVKMALGIVKPDEGSTERSPDLTVGYVPQSLTIDWALPLTVSRFMKLTGKASGADVAAALERTGIAHLERAELRTLSGGEFQRALLARAILRRPNLLVLDEPVQNVDYNGEAALYELIAAIRDELGCGVLMISHDLHVVMAATDRVICLNGHVCCSGTPRAVVETPEYRELFGSRAAGLAIYEHDHDHAHLPDGRVRHADGTITDGHDHHHRHGEGGHAG